jgi:hypothetical protein
LVEDKSLSMLNRKLAATRRRLRALGVAQAYWPLFVLALVFLAAALAGAFERLPRHAAALAIPALAACAAWLAWRGVKRYRPQAVSEAEQALDAQSELRPVSSLTDRPASHSPAALALWRQHRERLAAEVQNLRVPRLDAAWRALDPYRIRLILPVAVAVFALLAGGDGWGRLTRAMAPDYGVLAGADQMVVEAWVTPPEHTGRAPIFLRSGIEDVRVPAGSEITLRAQARSAPRLVLTGERRTRRIAFEPTPDGAYEARARLSTDGAASVHWWGERARFGFLVSPDAVPVIEFVSLPAFSGADRMEFTWSASDDYGVTAVYLAIRLREPHPAAPDAEDRVAVPLPGVSGLDKLSDTTVLDLTRHRWAGLPVELELVAIDGAGQEGRSERAPFVLPEKLFLDPVARAAQEVRVTVLREPRAYVPAERNAAAITPDAVNLAAASRLAAAPPGVQRAAQMLQGLTYRGDLFTDNLSVFMGLRMALAQLETAASKEEADTVEQLLWALALKVEFGSAADALRRFEAARRALERALRDGASEEEIRRLMQAFRDAANEYLAAKMAEAFARGGEPPPAQEDGAASAQLPGMRGQDFEDMLNALQDLAETGATDQARQLLADIANLLENLEFQRGEGGEGMAGMPGDGSRGEESDLPPEEQAMTDAMRRLSELLREQRQLNDDTLAQQRGEAPRTSPSPEGAPQQTGPGGSEEGEGGGAGQRPGEQQGSGGEGEALAGDPSGRGSGETLAERQARLGELVEEMARRMAEGEGEGTGLAGRLDDEALGAVREAQRRAQRALELGNEGRAIQDQERATQMLSQLSSDLARALDAMRASRTGREGDTGNDPLGREAAGVGNDGRSVSIPDEAERQRARDILDDLRRRLNESDDEAERQYLRRLLERF